MLLIDPVQNEEVPRLSSRSGLLRGRGDAPADEPIKKIGANRERAVASQINRLFQQERGDFEIATGSELYGFRMGAIDAPALTGAEAALGPVNNSFAFLSR